MEFFLYEVELSLNLMNTGNLINHLSINWGQFKYPLCKLCLYGAVVSSLSLMQEFVGSRINFYKNCVYEFTEFSESK